jgi:DNA-binding CsgD family transcriptional regulator
MKDSWLDAKSERMLELLAEGSPSRVIARQMGYQEGTMRVYLHKLYKKIGVANKTEAVIWYLNRGKAAAQKQPMEPLRAPIRASGNNDLFGEMALQEDLYSALGVMSEFLGPFGRQWEIGARLSGDDPDLSTQQRRETARQLWRALLRGDGGYGKRIYDEDEGLRLSSEAPAEAMLLTSLLVIGGFSSAAENLLARLGQKRKGAAAPSLRDLALVRSLGEAVETGDANALTTIYKAATEGSGSPAQRQSAMVMLFHAYRLRKDATRARQTANAVWAEAEAARRELEAMGDRPLAPATLVPLPDKGVVRQPASKEREKVAATR